MLKLELDWAADDAPDTGVVSDDGDDVLLVVEYDDAAGPSGWPTVRVYASTERPLHVAYMALDAWLRDVYGADDETAEELAALADDA